MRFLFSGRSLGSFISQRAEPDKHPHRGFIPWIFFKSGESSLYPGKFPFFDQGMIQRLQTAVNRPLCLFSSGSVENLFEVFERTAFTSVSHLDYLRQIAGWLADSSLDMFEKGNQFYNAQIKIGSGKVQGFGNFLAHRSLLVGYFRFVGGFVIILLKRK